MYIIYIYIIYVYNRCLYNICVYNICKKASWQKNEFIKKINLILRLLSHKQTKEMSLLKKNPFFLITYLILYIHIYIYIYYVYIYYTYTCTCTCTYIIYTYPYTYIIKKMSLSNKKNPNRGYFQRLVNQKSKK